MKAVVTQGSADSAVSPRRFLTDAQAARGAGGEIVKDWL